MPIRTQVQFVETYRGDTDHFTHVYDCLFVPGVERAGFEIIKPSIEGGELIHAALIGHLRRADMVLCDISSLNPNVFFELGIRTALDKPVAMVRDHHTPSAPFDTNSIHCHPYDPSLAAWTIEDEIDRLAAHLRNVRDSSGTRNSMWRHFGDDDETHRGRRQDRPNGAAPSEADAGARQPDPPSHLESVVDHSALLREISAITAGINAVISVKSADAVHLVLSSNGYLLDSRTKARIEHVASRDGVDIEIVD